MKAIKLVKFSIFSGLRAKELVGIDFNANNLKIAHVKLSGNKNEVLALFSRSIFGMKDEDISKVINETFM
ncbi:MAG: hypothetical protein ABIA66_01150, partial [Candidatus Omnitrophota bacterium]